MHDYNIIFDLESKKIGFIKAKCVFPPLSTMKQDGEEILYKNIFDLGKLSKIKIKIR